MDKAKLSSAKFTRSDDSFPSRGDMLKAWLYMPAAVVKPPVVIMAHGFGGERWMRLPAYAELFAGNGIAVLIFDYRGFNDSCGTPRNYINPSRHLQDWDAAIAHVKTLDNIDSARIALWGTSFSGGHVIVEAAKHPEISAVISHVPFTDGFSTVLKNYITADPVFAIKGVYNALADIFISLVSRRRHNVRIAGRPGESFALLSRPDSMTGILKITGMEEGEFEKMNFCPADIILSLSLYRPLKYAGKVRCPSLVIGAEKDTLFPASGPARMAGLMKNAFYAGYPMGHFDPYDGELFIKISEVMVNFLTVSLKAGRTQL